MGKNKLSFLVINKVEWRSQQGKFGCKVHEPPVCFTLELCVERAHFETKQTKSQAEYKTDCHIYIDNAKAIAGPMFQTKRVGKSEIGSKIGFCALTLTGSCDLKTKTANHAEQRVTCCVHKLQKENTMESPH